MQEEDIAHCESAILRVHWCGVKALVRQRFNFLPLQVKSTNQTLRRLMALRLGVTWSHGHQQLMANSRLRTCRKWNLPVLEMNCLINKWVQLRLCMWKHFVMLTSHLTFESVQCVIKKTSQSSLSCLKCNFFTFKSPCVEILNAKLQLSSRNAFAQIYINLTSVGGAFREFIFVPTFSELPVIDTKWKQFFFRCSSDACNSHVP